MQALLSLLVMSASNVQRNNAEKDASVEKVSYDEERSGGVTLRLANNVQAKYVLDDPFCLHFLTIISGSKILFMAYHGKS